MRLLLDHRSKRRLRLCISLASAWLVVGPGGTASAAPASVAEVCINSSEEGQRVRDEHAYLRARRLFVECAAARCPQVVRDDCTRWLDELQRMQPSVVVVGRDEAGEDVRDVRVTIDGETIAHTLDGRAIPLDPGEHEIVLEHGAERQSRRVLVISGERERRIEARWQAPKPHTVTLREPESRSVVAPAVVAGVGAVAVGAAFYLWAAGVHDLGVLTSDPCAAQRNCPSSFDDRERAVRTRIVVGDVVFGAGVAALGVATWLVLRPFPRGGGALTLGPAMLRVVGTF